MKMKNKLKEWLGILELENEIRISEDRTGYGLFCSFPFISRRYTLADKYKSLREDFEELDAKYDKLEKYLKIEFVELKGNVSSDDCAEYIEQKEYRKLKTLKNIVNK